MYIFADSNLGTRGDLIKAEDNNWHFISCRRTFADVTARNENLARCPRQVHQNQVGKLSLSAFYAF